MDWPTSYKFYVTIISSSDQRRDLYNVDVFWSPDLSSSAFMSNTKPFLYRTSSWSPGLSKESLEPCCVWSSSVPIKVLDWSMSSSWSSNQWCSPPRTGWWMETSSRVSLCSNSCGHHHTTRERPSHGAQRHMWGCTVMTWFTRCFLRL